MKTILLGYNMVDVIEIKKKDFDKHYLKVRGQTYRIFPDGLTRMRIFKNGTELESDEVIVYPENGVIPHNTQGLDYTNKARHVDIDLHKDAVSSGGMFSRFKFWATAGKSFWSALAPYLGLIIAGCIVAWAFLS